MLAIGKNQHNFLIDLSTHTENILCMLRKKLAYRRLFLSRSLTRKSQAPALLDECYKA